MNQNNCITELELAENRPSDWDLPELKRRAGALVREVLAKWPPQTRRAHREDMHQTAMMAFLEYVDQRAMFTT